MKSISRKLIVSALSLSLVAGPLVACAGQQNSPVQETSADSSTSVSNDSSVAEATDATVTTDDGASTGDVVSDVSALKTMGDALSVPTDSRSSTYNEQTYLYAYNTNTAPVRVVAKLTPEIYAQLSGLDISVSDYDDKVKEVMGAVELTRVDDLSAGIPAQAELDALVGKTGQELLDAGYTHFYLMAFGDDVDGQAVLEKGDYQYAVTFNEHIASDVDDNEDAIRNLTVKSVQYFELSSSAMNPDLF